MAAIVGKRQGDQAYCLGQSARVDAKARIAQQYLGRLWAMWWSRVAGHQSEVWLFFELVFDNLAR